MDHSLLVNSIQRMRSNNSFDLLRQPEWHQLRDAKRNAASEGVPEIDTEDFSVRDVD